MPWRKLNFHAGTGCLAFHRPLPKEPEARKQRAGLGRANTAFLKAINMESSQRKWGSEEQGLQRRDLLMAASGLSAVALLDAAAGCAQAPVSNQSLSKGRTMYAYVGSRTTRERNARGDGITVYRVAPSSGALEPVQVVGDLINPSYLTLSRDGRFLYSIHGDETEVSAFTVDPATGMISFLNRQSTEGKNPVHLALDRAGANLVVTNHIGSSLAVLPVAADGSLRPLTQLVKLSGPIGPHRIEQKQSKPHFNPFDPTGNFVVVPDKGLDRVFCYRYAAGKLEPAAVPFVTTREGAGPRHLAFHPSKTMAYVVNELDSTVTTYRFNPQDGSLQPLQILSTLPPTFTGNSRAAGIAVDRTGQRLYASNRGHDSIAVFTIDAATGLLTFTGADASQGRTPRFFTLSRDERFLYALNEDSDTIVVLAVDAETGRLRPTGLTAKTGSPVCMVFSA
jgi:6-phosphogluconolactonase (cycloisomerase 2 family)